MFCVVGSSTAANFVLQHRFYVLSLPIIILPVLGFGLMVWLVFSNFNALTLRPERGFELQKGKKIMSDHFLANADDFDFLEELVI